MPPLNPPGNSTALWNQLNRRDFLRLSAASTALVTLAGCRNKMPVQEIIPLNQLFEDAIPDSARAYTTTFPMPGFVQGLIVESHEAHPTKIEGNPKHSTSFGATSLFAQSSVLDLYSPFRMKSIRGPSGKSASPDELKTAFAKLTQLAIEKKGQGLAVLTGEVISPTLKSQIADLQKRFPEIRFFQDEPCRPKRLFEAEYRFTNTQRIVSFDCDFLGVEANAVKSPMEFSEAKRKLAGDLRSYIFEPGLSVTGTKADHRFAMTPAEIDGCASELENRISTGQTKDLRIESLAQDLLAAKGKSLILAGAYSSERLQNCVYRINLLLGNIGQTVRYFENEKTAGLDELVRAIENKKVDSLLIIGGDPVSTATPDLGFLGAIRKLNLRMHACLEPNPTSEICHWQIPLSHYLESWSDAQASDGTESLIQPLLSPMYDSVSAHEILGWLKGDTSTDYEIVRSYWQSRVPGNFAKAWRTALIDGVWNLPRFEKKPYRQISTSELPTSSTNALQIIFRPDPTIWDGRYKSNAWLQEVPKPPTQLVWDNALCVAPELAKSHGLSTGDLARVKTKTGELDVAVFLQPGLSENAIMLTLGYGQTTSKPEEGGGFNANLLRADGEWSTAVLELKKIPGHYELACTQTHHEIGERGLMQEMSVAAASLKRKPEKNEKIDIGLAIPRPGIPSALVSQTQQWAMSIDTDSCIGCSVCVVACQAENNIPVVGKRMVIMGREMHWIRIDRYSKSGNRPGAPLPVTCMQCETAPCEEVCPVAATNHSSTGLNQMVYNRCVGTRYCSNNCPYKVRRFNFFKWADNMDGSLAAQRNPDVTIRARGVMEKCNYCVQRIERARIQASKDNRPIQDGEIRTACEQACPTKAITFGNLKDPLSRILKERNSARTYGLLTELGTRPRTTYKAQISNSNRHLET